MKYYYELKAEMKAIQQLIVDTKKNELANALKEVKILYKNFSFTAEMFTGAIVKGGGDK